ncbi:hypothetical protein M1D34_07405 [Ensifer sp. D2-11]
MAALYTYDAIHANNGSCGKIVASGGGSWARLASARGGTISNVCDGTIRLINRTGGTLSIRVSFPREIIKERHGDIAVPLFATLWKRTRLLARISKLLNNFLVELQEVGVDGQAEDSSQAKMHFLRTAKQGQLRAPFPEVAEKGVSKQPR